MDKLYTINDIALFTDLSTRTLRNYLKSGVLVGEKIDGVWKFTEEEIDAFMSNPNVKSSITAKSNAIVYDFMLNKHKKTNEICTILDLNVNDTEAAEISEYFCTAVNNCTPEAGTNLSFEKNGSQVRLILKGSTEQVLEIINSYYT